MSVLVIKNQCLLNAVPVPEIHILVADEFQARRFASQLEHCPDKGILPWPRALVLRGSHQWSWSPQIHWEHMCTPGLAAKRSPPRSMEPPRLDQWCFQAAQRLQPPIASCTFWADTLTPCPTCFCLTLFLQERTPGLEHRWQPDRRGSSSRRNMDNRRQKRCRQSGQLQCPGRLDHWRSSHLYF